MTEDTLPAVPPTVVVQERISWGAILGGAVTAIAVGTLLHSLGFALGLSAIDPSNPSSFRASSIFTGVWSLVTAFLALFAGGMVAARVAGVATRTAGAIHGLVMWGLTTIVGAFLVFNVLTHAVSGAAAVGKTAIEGGAAAAGEAGGITSALGINFDDLLAPVNQRLQAEGKPKVTASQLEAASKDVVQTAVRQGHLDRETLISSIAAKTNLSRADATDLATRVESALGQTRGAASDAANSLQTGALRAAESTGKAFWGVFGALLIGMVSAVAGASLGVRRQRYWPPDRGLPVESARTMITDPFGPRHSRTYP
jgi:hypothetical protein